MAPRSPENQRMNLKILLMVPAFVQLMRQLDTKMCTKRLAKRIKNPMMMLYKFIESEDIFTKPKREMPMIRMARDSQFSAMVLYKSVVIFLDLLCIFGRVYREQIIPQNKMETMPENSRL